MAWILRFTSNAKVSKNLRSTVGYLKVDEIDSAEKRIIRLEQVDSFDGYNDSRLKGLNVYLDESGLIRYTHELLKHAGISTTMSTLREKIWILSSREEQFVRLLEAVLFIADTRPRVWMYHCPACQQIEYEIRQYLRW